MVVALTLRQNIRRRPLFILITNTRSLSTESISHSTSSNPPPPSPSISKQKQRRTTNSDSVPVTTSQRRRTPTPYPSLPSNFGQNQLLSVSQSTRALLENIVAKFDAPIRYAFAYGSGVFEQDGYQQNNTGNAPMLDFMFAVNHPAHWHSINLNQNPSHYSFHSRVLGSDFVTRVQSWEPGVWFNAYVPVDGVNIKYGVTTLDNMCSDLLSWRSLYIAGRMHKPIRIIKDDARVRLTQQVNLTSALRVALLTLPESFEERDLFEKITGISYSGDPRMWLPAENRGKIANIVRAQTPQFRELYRRLAAGLPGVHWPVHSSSIQQDTSATIRSSHLQKLPNELLTRLVNRYHPESRQSDAAAYYLRFAGDPQLSGHIEKEIRSIVRRPATTQTAKGFLSAGLGQSLRYSTGKMTKWWQGSAGTQSK